MKGNDVIIALKKKLRVNTYIALADKLGITAQAVQNWKKCRSVTPRQFVGLVESARKSGAIEFQVNAIRPLVEFYPINKCDSKQGAKYELFDIKTEDGNNHQYRAGLRKDLSSSIGIYIFFDSSGRAIYTGKARQQTLWKEMNNAFNRARGAVQKIKRVKHPGRNQPYKDSDEKARQIKDKIVPLHELACYFSAYDVSDGMINDLEAMLVRSFANDLLNKRMERFGRQRKKKRGRSRRR